MAGNASNWFKPKAGPLKGQAVYLTKGWQGQHGRAEVLRRLERNEQGGVNVGRPEKAAQRGGAFDRDAGVPEIAPPKSKSSAVRWLVERVEPQSITRREYEQVGVSSRGRPIQQQVERFYDVPGTGYFAGRIPDAMARRILEHAAKLTGDRFASSWQEDGFRFSLQTGQYRSTFGQVTFTYTPADDKVYDLLDRAIDAGTVEPTRVVR